MDEREFLEASNTMVNIAQAVKQRVEQLESMAGSQSRPSTVEN